MEPQSTSAFLDRLVSLNASLQGLPAMPFITVACIMLGIVIKWVPVIDNKWIPTCVLLTAIVSYVFMMPLPEPSTAWLVAGWLARNILMGMIAGALAILLHRKGLKKLEAKFGWFADDEPESPKP